MPNISITYDGRYSVQSIQAQFRNQLSEREILKTTARAINETAKKVQGHIRKEVRKDYTVNNKYLDRMSYVSKMAAGTNSGLYSEVKFSYRPVPMIGFKHTGGTANKRGKKKNISVTIKKGQAKTFRHAFLATFKSGHKGIFANGYYDGGKFTRDNTQTGTGKGRITELKSTSPFSMMNIAPMRAKINTYVDRSLPSRLQYFLQQKIDRMTR